MVTSFISSKTTIREAIHRNTFSGFSCVTNSGYAGYETLLSVHCYNLIIHFHTPFNEEVDIGWQVFLCALSSDHPNK